MVPPKARSEVDASFPLRLRSARLRAGLSLGELADRLGGMVTRQAIAKYEKGEIAPSPEVLAKLEEALDIRPYEPPYEPPEYEGTVGAADTPVLPRRRTKPAAGTAFQVFREYSLFDLDRPPGQVSSPISRRAQRILSDWEEADMAADLVLRPEPRFSAKQTTALSLELEERMRSYLRLEKLLKMETKFESPLGGMRLAGPEDAESAAAALRRNWELGGGCLADLLALLEEKGVKVFKLEGPDFFESISGEFQGYPFIAVKDSLPLDRLRFKASAELAQVLFGFSGDPGVLRLYNRFAAALLLPADVLREYFLPAGRKIAFGELEAVKLRYGVSIQAVMYRAFDLGLVTERRLRSFREMMKEKGWLTCEPVEYRGLEDPARFRRLLHYAVSSGILDLAAAAALAGTTPEELSRGMGEVF